MEIVQRITKLFSETFGDTPAHIVRAPGRVNLLGEHVDYNDGFVLPAAIDRATYIAFSPVDSPDSTLVAADLDQQASFSPSTITSNTRLIVLNYPSNPTGAYPTREYLQKLQGFAAANNLWIISDAVYENLYYGEKPVSAAAIHYVERNLESSQQLRNVIPRWIDPQAL